MAQKMMNFPDYMPPKATMINITRCFMTNCTNNPQDQVNYSPFTPKDEYPPPIWLLCEEHKSYIYHWAAIHAILNNYPPLSPFIGNKVIFFLKLLAKK